MAGRATMLGRLCEEEREVVSPTICVMGGGEGQMKGDNYEVMVDLL